MICSIFNYQAADTLSVLLCCFEKNILLVFFCCCCFLLFCMKYWFLLSNKALSWSGVGNEHQPVSVWVGPEVNLCVSCRRFSLGDPFRSTKMTNWWKDSVLGQLSGMTYEFQISWFAWISFRPFPHGSHGSLPFAWCKPSRCPVCNFLWLMLLELANSNKISQKFVQNLRVVHHDFMVSYYYVTHWFTPLNTQLNGKPTKRPQSHTSLTVTVVIILI